MTAACDDASETGGDPLDRDRIAQLERLYGGGRLAEVLRDCVAEFERLRDAIREAAGRDDPAALREAAHSAKGLAASFGAPPLAALLNDLEQTGRSGDIPDGRRLDALSAEVERARGAYEKLGL